MLISFCINLATTATPAQQQQLLEYAPNTKIKGTTDNLIKEPYFTCLVLSTILFRMAIPGTSKRLPMGRYLLQAFVNKSKLLVIHSLLMLYVALPYTSIIIYRNSSCLQTLFFY